MNSETQKTETTEKKTLKFEDIKEIVDYLVRTKSSSYSFDCYEPEDIAQEIRIICFNALAKFDHERVEPDKWQNYFGRCVDNGLKNLKRDNYIRTSSPYKKRFQGLEAADDSEEAKKIRELYDKFQNNIKRKLGIIHAKPIESLEDDIKTNKFQEEMEYKDLENYLIEMADPNTVGPLKLLLSGKHKEVNKKDKRRVQAFVKKLLEK